MDESIKYWAATQYWSNPNVQNCASRFRLILAYLTFCMSNLKPTVQCWGSISKAQIQVTPRI